MRVSAHTPQNYFQSPDWYTNQKLGNISIVYRDTVTLLKSSQIFFFHSRKEKGLYLKKRKIKSNKNEYFRSNK